MSGILTYDVWSIVGTSPFSSSRSFTAVGKTGISTTSQIRRCISSYQKNICCQCYSSWSGVRHYSESTIGFMPGNCSMSKP